MTQLAETLFSNTPPIAWPQLLTLQSTEIKHVTYCQGQFNISAQELPLSSRNYYYLTLIAPSITSEALLNLLSTLSQRLQSTQDSRDIILYPPANYALNNNVLTDKQVPLEKAVNQGDIIVLGFTTLSDELQQQFKDTLVSWSSDYHVDYALSQTLPSLKQPGVVLMDMDSTTIQIECIDEIAKLAGVGEQVAAVTARAMNGELDFSESLRSRVATLTNCPEAVLTQVADAMPLMPGLELLIATLHQANWKVAIASGGFTYFAKRLQDDLGFDAVYANELEIVDGILTGKVIGNIVDAQVKADTLQALAQEYQITPQQTVAIGDGANDLIMLKSAALGVAIHAKPIVQQQAQVALNYHDLEGLVGLLQAANCVDASWS
ncbi:phosphoserine phosphatase SerB [Moritella viscosa]|uniref:Phosphoserine phosphatase n=1 Tax=Moritella viscosa TaxID=80854 RepID=A0ABY1HES6_9GAMM|nr:phosphoserine phosphatase SerB [Moritella viscosa]SGY90364.1 Phosphoserine phosphatase [Moritella viscosa]SGY99454.1 Phosphoserine phosphatase [Moritella viscosa]SHO26010.1 Phosphoserine phosphatase [Moritella viscosa]